MTKSYYWWTLLWKWSIKLRFIIRKKSLLKRSQLIINKYTKRFNKQSGHSLEAEDIGRGKIKETNLNNVLEIFSSTERDKFQITSTKQNRVFLNIFFSILTIFFSKFSLHAVLSHLKKNWKQKYYYIKNVSLTALKM